MAQKTLTRETPRTSSSKPRKAVPAVPVSTQSTKVQYPEVNAAIDRGLADVAAGRVYIRRSYAEYANSETED